MIAAVPTGWTQSTYALCDPAGAGAPFGEISFRLFGSARLSVGADDFEIETSGWMQTTLALTDGVRRLAVAERPSLWRRRTVVTVTSEALGTLGLGASGDLALGLAPDDLLAQGWTLTAGGEPVGRAVWERRRLIRRQLTATFPDSLPLVVQAFRVAVVAAKQRRKNRS